MKVLLVDDEFNVRDSIRYLGQWERMGVTDIWEADNGEQAQAIILKEQPEIIFTDIKMPKVDGIQLMQWLDERTYPGKVIVLSGYDDYSFMRKAIQYASYDYLLKPVEADVLNSVLEGAVREWKSEQEERSKISYYEAEGRWQHVNRLITDAAENKPWDWEELSPCLPEAEAYDVHVLYFYHTSDYAPYVRRLADELAARSLGYAFLLLNDSHSAVVISASGRWPEIEEWIVDSLDIPVRLVTGKPIKALDEFQKSYQKAVEEMERNQFRTLHPVSDSDDSRRMDEIVKYLEEHFTEEFCLDTLSERFFLSREHISRRFKQEQGMNISHYLIHLRLEEAKRLLSQTDEKMVSIAIRIGYQNEKYFSKLFKRMVGLTPAQYRESHRQPTD